MLGREETVAEANGMGVGRRLSGRDSIVGGGRSPKEGIAGIGGFGGV